MNFTREDWRLFLKRETLCQKAGVREGDLLRLVVKELTDNALDVTEGTGGDVLPVALGLLGNGFYVQDYGPGMTREQVTNAFSVNRPLVSSKLLRLPTRGALGNGLRVVTGAAAADSGQGCLAAGLYVAALHQGREIPCYKKVLVSDVAQGSKIPRGPPA